MIYEIKCTVSKTEGKKTTEAMLKAYASARALSKSSSHISTPSDISDP